LFDGRVLLFRKGENKMSEIAAIFAGYGIEKTTDEMIRAGAHIETSIAEEEVDGKTVKYAVEKATGKKLKDGEFETVVSNSNEDRYFEKILVEGIDLKQIKKNPVVLWGHDYRGLPIGKITKIWVDNGNLMARIQLSVEKYDFAKQVYDLILDGVINAVSLGGQVKKWSEDYSTIEQLELYEVSVVPVGAHRDALITERSMGVDADKAKQLRKSFADFENDAMVDKLKAMPQDEITSHIASLKALTSALERTHSTDTEEDEGDAADKTKSVRKLILVRSTAKTVDKVSELLIATINNKLKDERK
jgi:HK97 family phage prohead protease